MRKTDLELSRLLFEALPPTMRAIRDSMRDFRECDLTVPQFRTLSFISLQPCTNKQLAGWLGVSLPAMTRMVDRLVKQKLLLRTPDKADRRQIRIRLSRKGRQELESMRKFAQNRLVERIVLLNTREKRALSIGLAALRRVVQ